MTKEEINKKYRNKYIEVYRTYNYSTGEDEYEVRKVYDKIHENTTLGQDVGTSKAYTR